MGEELGQLEKPKRAVRRTNEQGIPKTMELVLWHYSSPSHRSTERHPRTTKVGEQALDDLPELDLISRGTFQWSRTSPGEPSGARPRRTEITTIPEHLTTIPEHLKTFREH
ncbi:hypothetical protein CRG98_023467 [Punica granatum]|uniref:Uncharacterized protein n=1 Tax=Punica granatum TaxID=22663 RepID=A0A2I0JIR0_PUNGR|nr:hypothetical protein CRG98_023467 [Punica granatum]